MRDVTTYRAKDVLIIFGASQLHGFSEEDMVAIKPHGEGTQIYVGADGEVGRSLDPDECLEVTIELAKTSESNDVLTNYYNLDRKTGKGLVPLMIKDLSGTTLVAAKQAWVTNVPEVKLGKKINSNSWTIHTGAAEVLFGGNN